MARLYYGGYGHHPSGRSSDGKRTGQYVYWGGDNYRTGQNVVVPVTDKRTGKTYNTMFTIQRTSGADTQMAQNEAQRVESKINAPIKFIEGRDVLSLPSGEFYKSKAEWKRASDIAYDANMRLRSIYGRANQTFSTRNSLIRRFGR